MWALRLAGPFAQVTLKRSTRLQKNSAVQIDVREGEDAFYARVTFMLTKILLFLSHSHLPALRILLPFASVMAKRKLNMRFLSFQEATVVC